MGARAWLEALLARHWAQPSPTPLARSLQPLAGLYRVLLALRQALYAGGWLHTHRSPVPVLVVGNLVAGGAGKTPVVMALVQALQQQGWMPGVVSRGHGRQASGVALVGRQSSAADVGDEPLLIHQRSRVPVAVGTDRVAAAQRLCQAHPQLNLIIADDGLQHLRWARDVQVIVIDSRGLGNGLLLPAGPLRQAPPGQLDAGTLVLYNATTGSSLWPGFSSQRRLGRLLPLAAWWRGGAVRQHASLPAAPVLAAAGLAQPEPFFAMLRAAGIALQSTLALPDHYDFHSLPWPVGTPAVIVTEKDAVKLAADRPGCEQVWVAPLDFLPDPAFIAAIMAALPRKPSP